MTENFFWHQLGDLESGFLSGVGSSRSLDCLCLMAVLMDSLAWLNDLIYPMMVVVQTIPTIAIAPILVLWLG